MGSSIKVHQSVGTDNVDRALSTQERKQLDRLVRLWKSHAERGLKTRHATGKALNQQVGPPTERKAHGQRVLELYGAELDISPSELSRMGWFSHLFPDFSAFCEQHPEVDSWTKFKTELPRLKPSKGGKAGKPVAKSSRPAIRGVAEAIANLTSKLNRLDSPPVQAERAKLVVGLRELAEAASSRLMINVVVAVE